MEPPKGLILFHRTPVGQELVRERLKRTVTTVGITLVLLIASVFIDFYNMSIIMLGMVMLFAILLFIQALDFLKIAKIPIAVNLNHPFMENHAVGDSEVMLRFGDEWIESGVHRLLVTKDPALGYLVHRQDSEQSLLCAWPKYNKTHLVLINQAISLNNAINDSNDEFADARERENQDSGLLEREWMPEEEIDLEGPISRMFNND